MSLSLGPAAFASLDAVLVYDQLTGFILARDCDVHSLGEDV